MIKIGLTGNIGSGKSLVAGIFRILGVPVFHADNVGREILAGDGITLKLKELFSPAIIDVSGRVDRKKLAGIVFNDPIALGKLNSLIHPLVMESFSLWCAGLPDPYILMESAILFESGLENEFDRIIHVSCPENIATERVILRDRLSEAEVKARQASQLSDEEKKARADFVVLNDGQTLVIPQVLRIQREILEICP